MSVNRSKVQTLPSSHVKLQTLLNHMKSPGCTGHVWIGLCCSTSGSIIRLSILEYIGYV